MFKYLAPFYNILLGGVQRRQEKIIRQVLSELQGYKILDLGGGTGRLAYSLYKEKADIYMMDHSREMLRQVPKGFPAERIVWGDAAQVPVEDSTFEVVLVVDALHHFTNQRETIREILRILSPEGKLVILDFDRQHFAISLLAHLERILGESASFRQPRELETLVYQAGFSRVTWRRTNAYEYLLVAQK